MEIVRNSSSAAIGTNTASQNAKNAADAAQKGLSQTLNTQAAKTTPLVSKSKNSNDFSLANVWAKVKSVVYSKLNITSVSAEIKKATVGDAQKIKELKSSIATNEKIINASGKPNNLTRSLERQNDADKTNITALENKMQIIEKHKNKVFKLVQSKKNTIAFKKGTEIMVITKDKQGNLSIAKTNIAAKALGEGEFGIVYNAENISSDKSSGVIKLAKNNRGARADVKNEHTMLSELHKNGVVKGLQAAPHAVFNYTNKKYLGLVKEKQTGYVGVKYDGDGFDLFFNKSLKNDAEGNAIKSDIIGQVCEGRAALKKAGIYHGDIKPENMLFRENKGKFEVVIADLGGARKFSDLFAAGPPFIGTYTPAYQENRLSGSVDRLDHRLEQLKAIEKPTANEKATIQKVQNMIQVVMERIDDYALGLSLLELWAGTKIAQPVSKEQVSRMLAGATDDVKMRINELLFGPSPLASNNN